MAEASRVVGTAHCMHNRCSIPVAVVEVHFLRLQNTHDIPQCYTEHRALACGTSDLACGGGPGGRLRLWLLVLCCRLPPTTFESGMGSEEANGSVARFKTNAKHHPTSPRETAGRTCREHTHAVREERSHPAIIIIISRLERIERGWTPCHTVHAQI